MSRGIAEDDEKTQRVEYLNPASVDSNNHDDFGQVCIDQEQYDPLKYTANVKIQASEWRENSDPNNAIWTMD